MANPIVIDISHHQPDPIDWDKVKAGGTIGVIHKATEGTNYTDPTWKDRITEAMAAGLLVSTYHFMRPSPIVEQMKHYLGSVDQIMPLGSRVCLDHEDEQVSLSELEDAVHYILDVRPDLQITIYSGHLIKEQLGSKCSAVLADNTSLWIAQYGSSVSWPEATWPAWSLWQFTDKSAVSGITGPVDGNKWNGSEEGLITWLSPAGQLGGLTYVVTPEPQVKPVVTIAVEGEVDLQVSIDGIQIYPA